MKRLWITLLGLLLLCVGSMQAQGTFNPAYPADPQTPVFYYPLTVKCEPAGAGYASGNGSYAPGTSRYISTSAYSGYTFNHWELNGVPYNGASGTYFNYTTVAGKMDFVAVYDFTPNYPSEPVMHVKSRLYLASEPAGICTFNRTSGDYVEADQYVSVNVTGVDQQYEFTGWWLNGTKLTDVQAFNHLMGYHDETLVAHFQLIPFNPAFPADPQMAAGQPSVQTYVLGDANEDGTVDVADAVAVINVYLTGDSSNVNISVADANGDGVIDIADAVYIINVYLTNQ